MALYVSEATRFLQQLKENRPSLEAEQQRGRAIWWDKAPIDLERRAEESDGSRTLEYPRGPMGKETYFVTIGADGRFRRIEQVLTEENFRKVQPGMTRDQVRQILGKPGEISRFKRQNEEVWGWRYLEATQRTMFFYAHFDQDTGLLKRTDQMQDWKTSKH